jgi:23S rRNA (guanosine2251-2'-O)-methyltransferase
MKEHAQEWLYGLNPVLEALRAGRRIKTLYIYAGRHEKVAAIRTEADARGVPVVVVTESAFFDDRFPKGHQGIAARISRRKYVPIDELLLIPGQRGEEPFFVILDLIEDPRNLGGILRSSEAAGVHGVVIQERRAAGLGPEASKASAGASEYLPVSMVPNIKHAMHKMKESGIKLIGAEAGSADPPWALDLSGPAALVVGSEGAGLRRTVREGCDVLTSLPMRGMVNSLNTSVAAGVLIYEILRQRSKKY